MNMYPNRSPNLSASVAQNVRLDPPGPRTLQVLCVESARVRNRNVPLPLTVTSNPCTPLLPESAASQANATPPFWAREGAGSLSHSTYSVPSVVLAMSALRACTLTE